QDRPFLRETRLLAAAAGSPCPVWRRLILFAPRFPPRPGSRDSLGDRGAPNPPTDLGSRSFAMSPATKLWKQLLTPRTKRLAMMVASALLVLSVALVCRR